MGVDGFAVTGDPLKQSLSGAGLAIRDPRSCVDCALILSRYHWNYTGHA
jgi:hypothetical protein